MGSLPCQQEVLQGRAARAHEQCRAPGGVQGGGREGRGKAQGAGGGRG